MSSSNNNNNNNNKQPLDLTESLLVFDKAQAPSTTTVNVGDVDLGIPEINQVAAAPQNLVQSAEAPTTTPTVNKLDHDGISLVERRSRDVKPREKNDSLGISGINQPDVTTQNLSRSDELTIGFLLDCAKRGQNRGNQRQPSICKVSRMLRDHCESSYEPQLVSIGPIHREDPKLQEFEGLKERYLNDLLNRCNSTPKETLEACLQKVNDLMPQIRESYAGVIKNYSDVELARMMVMDGFFILEFCFSHEHEEKIYLPNKMQNTRIAMDLMLLENQVLFSVLQALFDCSMGEVSFTLNDVLDTYLAPYILLFCSDLLPEKKSILNNVLDKYLTPYIRIFRPLLPEKILTTDSDLAKKISATDVHSDSTPGHVLGYLHKRYQLVDAEQAAKADVEMSKLVDEEQAAKADVEMSKLVDAEQAAKADVEMSKLVDEERKEILVYHSIVELDRSGMNFKPHQEGDRSMTIKLRLSFLSCLPWFWECCCCCCLFPCLSGFWSKSTLLMPTLLIDDFTELILRNFIAYEQSFPKDRYYFTSYAHAMHMLIDTQEDIAKLVESKVLVNTLASNQEAADMIHKICKNISITDFYYAKEFKQMDEYYSRFWPMIKRTYFSNPWNAINLLFGIIAFLATVVSAIFAILDYFR